MKNNLIFCTKLALLVAVLTLSGCMKDQLALKGPSVNAQNLNDLVAPTDFQWRTSTTVAVDLTGLNTVVPITNTLSISSKQGVLYKTLHLMSESKMLKVDVPTNENILTLKYGSITLIAPIINNKASFSFIPVLN